MDKHTNWSKVERHLAAAVEAARSGGDEALDRLAHRLEGELVDLRFQRSPVDD